MSAVEPKGSQLWSKLIANSGFNATRGVLGDSFELFREALRCFDSGYYMASTLLCRAALDSAVYKLAITRDLEGFRTKGLEVVAWNPLEDRSQFVDERSYGKVRKRASQYFRIGELIGNIERVREKGHFVAHYSQRVDHELQTKTRERRYSDTVALWIDGTEALAIVTSTENLLSKIIDAVVDRIRGFDK